MTVNAIGRVTYDYIALHARRRAEAVALLLDGQPFTYRDLSRDLRAAVSALQPLVPPQGGLVAVGFDDFRTQLLAMLALEALGLAAAGFRTTEGAACAALLARAELVLAQETLAEPCRRLVVLKADWPAREQTTDPTPPNAAPATVWQALIPPVVPEDAPFMVVRSSGTTGQSKLMVITRSMQHARLRERVRTIGIGRRTRYLATMQLGVGQIYTTAVSTLRTGGLVASESTASVADAIRRRRPNLVTLLPYQLAQMMTPTAGAETMPSTAEARIADLLLVVTGSRLEVSLRRAALQKLCGRLIEIYGSNECGIMATVDADGLAQPCSGIDMQSVDTHGLAASPGTVGEIRARGPTVVRAYLDDDAVSAVVFRNGWFNTGDLAVCAGPGKMRLLGRPDEVVNIGGIKLSSIDLERVAADTAAQLAFGLRDVAVVAAVDANSQPLLVICATGLCGSEAQALSESLRATMQVRYSVACMDEIPRTAAGKLRREELRRIVDVALRR